MEIGSFLFKYKKLTALIVLQFLFLMATGYRGGHVSDFLWLFLASDVGLILFACCDDVRIKSLVLSVFTSLALSLDRHLAVEPDEGGLLLDGRLQIPLMIMAFYFMYKYLYEATKAIRADGRGRACSQLLAAFFSLCCLMGYSYQETDSWELVFANSQQICKSYIFLTGAFFAIYYCLAWGYAIADKYRTGGRHASLSWRPISWYLGVLREHPFRTAFLTLLICNLPYFITAYPGIFAGDTIDQLLQAFQIPYNSAKSTNLITESQLINQHHSVLHTMFMHYMLCIGVYVFHSANIGIFLISGVQALLTLAAISYLIATVVTEGASDMHALLLIAFFVISPRIQNFLFVLSKDVPYGAVTLISIVLMWKLASGRQCTGLTKYAYILSLVLMQALRKEAVYIIIIQMIIMLFAARKSRPVWGTALIVTMVVYLVMGKLVFPAFDISPSPVNEALSIPIQQTARYLQEYPGDVTKEDVDDIDRMWDYDELLENYDPNRSDIAKATFRNTSTRSDWTAYFSAWARMLVRHPMVYVQATLNNYYEYFYPGMALAEPHTFDRRAWDIDYVNEKLGDIGVNIYYPQSLDTLRLTWEGVREKVFGLPVLSLFISVACYTWLLVACLAYWIYHKAGESSLMFLPLVLILLVCLAGPCNGAYFRYFYPIVLCLPGAASLASLSSANCR